MKKLIATTLLFLSMLHFNGYAQEKYGKTLNVGLGIGGYSGYYGYAGHTLPVFHLDYEFDVARNFTLAPFLNFYTYTNQFNYPDRYYTYRETVIPIGVKGAYYFDELLKANEHWDFYLAASLGFAIVTHSWSDGYPGDRNYYHGAGALFLDIHIGAEYHFNDRLGAFLDISSGVSTIGLAIHATNSSGSSNTKSNKKQ